MSYEIATMKTHEVLQKRCDEGEIALPPLDQADQIAQVLGAARIRERLRELNSCVPPDGEPTPLPWGYRCGTRTRK